MQQINNIEIVNKPPPIPTRVYGVQVAVSSRCANREVLYERGKESDSFEVAFYSPPGELIVSYFFGTEKELYKKLAAAQPRTKGDGRGLKALNDFANVAHPDW